MAEFLGKSQLMTYDEENEKMFKLYDSEGNLKHSINFEKPIKRFKKFKAYLVNLPIQFFVWA